MRHFFFVLLFSVAAQGSFANEYPYPELQVSPRASQRLKNEAKDEERRAWTRHVPIQSSALITIAAGSLALQDNIDPEDPTDSDEREDASEKEDTLQAAGQIGIGVGGAWLVGTALLSATYRPYKSCLGRLPKQTNSKRAALARERAAEECLREPARLARKLNILSVTTNFFAGAFIAGTGDDDLTVAFGSAAAAAAVLPWILPSHWQDVASYHEEYKKRIYGPLAEVTLLRNDRTKKYAPALSASLSF